MGFAEIYQLVVFQLLLRLVKEKYRELLERSTVVIVVPLLSVMNWRTRSRAIEHRLQSVFHQRWRRTGLFNELSVVYSLSCRNSQNSHPQCFPRFPDFQIDKSNSKAKTIEVRQNIVENLPRKLLFERSCRCSETLSFAMKTWLIIAVIHTTWAAVKLKPEKIQAWTGFEPMPSAIPVQW